MRNRFVPLFFILGGLVGALIIILIHQSKPGPMVISKHVSADISLLAPPMRPQDAKLQFNFAPLHDQLEQYLNSLNTNYSFYFEYLPTNTSMKIENSDELIAASLMKLPVVMNLYKASELKLINLDQKVTIQSEWVDNQFGEEPEVAAGKTVTLKRAAEIALIKSNNTAIRAVEESINGKLNDIYSSWRAINTQLTSSNIDDTTKIGADSYSSFLRCLYYSCFLTPDDSSIILQTLTQSDFNSRLTAPIPDSVKVAHKIGSYNNASQGDCGIVYYDQRPYIFCMIISLPSDQADQAIAHASEIVYKNISMVK